jgi:hypothetical protein
MRCGVNKKSLENGAKNGDNGIKKPPLELERLCERI